MPNYYRCMCCIDFTWQLKVIRYYLSRLVNGFAMEPAPISFEWYPPIEPEIPWSLLLGVIFSAAFTTLAHGIKCMGAFGNLEWHMQIYIIRAHKAIILFKNYIILKTHRQFVINLLPYSRRWIILPIRFSIFCSWLLNEGNQYIRSNQEQFVNPLFKTL